MKTGLYWIVSAFLSFNGMASDCPQSEAQVIGKAMVVSTTADECQVKFREFSMYHESGVCPLYVGEVMGKEVVIDQGNCQVLGEALQLSGVLIRKGDQGVLELE